MGRENVHIVMHGLQTASFGRIAGLCVAWFCIAGLCVAWFCIAGLCIARLCTARLCIASSGCVAELDGSAASSYLFENWCADWSCFFFRPQISYLLWWYDDMIWWSVSISPLLFSADCLMWFILFSIVFNPTNTLYKLAKRLSRSTNGNLWHALWPPSLQNNEKRILLIAFHSRFTRNKILTKSEINKFVRTTMRLFNVMLFS